MVSIFTFLPEFQTDKVEPEIAPRVAVGAASPLWLMFGGAAAAGATYWWWANRWREAVNLEALMALTPEPVAPAAESIAVLEAEPEPVAESVVEAVALAAETTEAVIDATQDIVEADAEAAVETMVAANEDIAEALVAPLAEVEPSAEQAAEAPVEIAEAIAPAADAVAEAVQAAADDLTRLVGVGPKLAASLAELGVTTFGQIAAWTPDELASFDQILNLKGRAERDAWIAQAKRLAATPAEA